jgi:hypothetical protein
VVRERRSLADRAIRGGHGLHTPRGAGYGPLMLLLIRFIQDFPYLPGQREERVRLLENGDLP